jgi:nucleoside-diphosphate-sugar epimerase
LTLLVTGGNGRIGRFLRQIWAGDDEILWHARRMGPGVDVAWDMGAEPAPRLPEGLTVLHLAGRLSGAGADYADTVRAVCGIGAAQVLVMSSAAVYGPGERPWRESDPVAPQNPYAVAKLAAERVAMGQRGVTMLRLANLAGADGLLGGIVPGRTVVLDPVTSGKGGPERSYIGPQALALVLRGLIGRELPPVINVAQPGMVSMAGLLVARGAAWKFGPERAGTVARLVVDVSLLGQLVPLSPASPEGIVADLDGVAR